MHGLHIALTGSMQPASTQTGSTQPGSVQPFAIGWSRHAQSTSAAEQTIGWSWAKAIGISTEQPATSSQTAKQQVKLDQAMRPPDLSEASTDESAPANLSPVKQPAPQLKTVVDLAPEKIATEKKTKPTTSDKTAQPSDTSGHKASTPSNEPASPAATPEAPVVVPATIPVPAQVAITPDAAKGAPEDKPTGKAGTIAAKRANAVSGAGPARSDDSQKSAANDAKPSTTIEAAGKPAPEHELQTKTIEAFAATPQASNHSSNDASVAMSLSAGSASAHKPLALTPNTSSIAEPKTLAAGAGAAETNPAHTISAGPGQLEVGVLDGTHGWLSIRTEMGSNGGVNALLTSGATAHESLRETLPAMAGYLASEQLNVSKIAVGSVGESSFTGSDPAYSGQAPGGGQHGNQRGADDSARTAGRTASQSATQASAAAATAISSALFGGSNSLFRGDGIGSWLSVTA